MTLNNLYRQKVDFFENSLASQAEIRQQLLGAATATDATAASGQDMPAWQSPIIVLCKQTQPR